jgi:hypothetical protein
MPSADTATDEKPLDPRSAACVQCHSPVPDEPRPSASSGALWQGRVRVPAAEGAGWEELRAAGAHAAVPGGCVGCHGASATGRVDHSFRVDARSCKACHANGVEQPPDTQRALQDRAHALGQTIERACVVTEPAGAEPTHATPDRVVCRAPRLARALYEIDLVLEDPAAFVHNAALARSVLDDAERMLR